MHIQLFSPCVFPFSFRKRRMKLPSPSTLSVIFISWPLVNASGCAGWWLLVKPSGAHWPFRAAVAGGKGSTMVGSGTGQGWSFSGSVIVAAVVLLSPPFFTSSSGSVKAGEDAGEGGSSLEGSHRLCGCSSHSAGSDEPAGVRGGREGRRKGDRQAEGWQCAEMRDNGVIFRASESRSR